ncbi:fatty-acyl-CoA synthase/long-chain acyl-CoA synthetase [Burkholderia sp. GAS332]|nr:fatty-acyl-CoA synthase/long-chain acyl-CoA synthetase [Burkholderia sp. GAS332]
MLTPLANLTDIEALERADPYACDRLSSTYEMLRQGAAIDPDARALSFFARTEDFAQPHAWNHREWFTCVTRTANMLRGLGVQRGDVVACMLPNLPETHLAIWGSETAGIAFPVNPLLDAGQIATLLHAADARWLVTLGPASTPGLWEKALDVVDEVATLQGVLAVDGARYAPGAVATVPLPATIGKHGARVLDFHRTLEAARGDALDFAPPAATDIASYFGTGGTTGLPKIATRTHRTETANAFELGAMFGDALFAPGRTLFCGLPLFHVNSQIGLGLAPWARGAHVLLGPPEGYRANGLIERFWEIVEHHRVVTFSGVPTLYATLLNTPATGRDLSSLHCGICGAASMPVELLHRFEQQTGVRIIEGYGLTEAGCASSINPPGGVSRTGSVGLRLPWQDIRILIVDEQERYLRDADAGETGVVAISGPNLFAGYLDPRHNAAVWIDRPPASGGAQRWLNTGDLGRVDADGYLWLTGRKKDLIIRGGHNIDPQLIEKPLHTHPAVGLAAAIGRPDAHAGEVPVAYVQLRTGAVASSDELLAYAAAHIGERAAVPKRVHILQALPLTAVGKIFKPALHRLEIESVVRDEAAQCGAVLERLEVVADARRGWIARYCVTGESASLESRLGLYTFGTHKERG